MSRRQRYHDAAAALEHSALTGAELAIPFVGAVEVDGAAVTTLGDPVGTQTLSASDSVAARVDEIQIDLGEGPAWSAHASGRVVSDGDVQRSSGERWPLAHAALRSTGVSALHAVPLVIAGLRLGCVDLYSSRVGALTPAQTDDATALASIAARQVLMRAFADIAHGDDQMPAARYSRREVHQASGMIAAQLGIGVDDALAVLTGHAYGSERSVLDAARAVIERRLDFTERRPGGDLG